jgi:Xaa-Pro aminopeptidase
MKYENIDSQLFIENRNRLQQLMLPNSMAILLSNDEMPRSGDQNYDFHQQPDLFHLTGIGQEKTILLFFPDSPNPMYREALFIRRTNEHIQVWEGHKHSIEEAKTISGIQNIYWIDTFEDILPSLMVYADNVYINTNENDRAMVVVPYSDLRFAKTLREHYPAHTFKRLAPLMQQLRAVKQPEEIRLTQRAIDITREAFIKVLNFVKPGVMEYEVEAEIIGEFIRNRATGHAYSPIIASGANANILHYNDNNKPCNDGDMLLMDFGAEYAHYCADLTRTIPVNGRFSERQKNVYNAVLRVMKAAKEMLAPGVILAEYNNEVGKIMESELLGLGLLDKDDVAKQSPKQPLYKKYFMHGTSHFLGLDVHDVGARYEPMQVGNLFTVEPGIYIPEEKLGIRLENNVLITASGTIDLMANIPIEVEEIEDIMQGK